MSAKAAPGETAENLRFQKEQETRQSFRHLIDASGSEVVQLAAVLARLRPDLGPYWVAADALGLHKMGKEIARFAVTQCNRGLNDKQEARREALAARCREVASWYGAKAETGGDPRGYVLRLHGEGIPRTGWGEGFGVA